MIPRLPIAGIGAGEIVWVIIALVVVIARIIRAQRETGVQPQSPDPSRQPRPPEGNPQAELQRFLRTLAGEEEPVQAPHTQPPPPPPQARRVQPAARRAPRPAPVPVARPAMAVTPKGQTRQGTGKEAVAGLGLTDLSAGNTATQTRLQADLRRDLRQTHALRRGILLREILGPPVAMRQPGDGS